MVSPDAQTFKSKVYIVKYEVIVYNRAQGCEFMLFCYLAKGFITLLARAFSACKMFLLIKHIMDN